jgi:PAS domain S-box-containing protein
MWIFAQEDLAILAVNDAAVAAYGYSREQFLAMTILDIRPVADVPKLLRSALHPHPADGTRWIHQRKDGTVFPVRITSWEIVYETQRAELVRAEPEGTTCTANPPNSCGKSIANLKA